MASKRAGRGIHLAALAEELGLGWVGDADFIVEDVASIEHAGPSDLTFVRSPVYAKALAQSRAGAVIAPEGVELAGRPAILSPNPARDFARAVERLRVTPRPAAGVHPTAWVDESAHVDATAAVGPGVRIGGRARVGAATVLHANVVLYPDAEVGDGCELHAGVVVREDCTLGHRVVLQPGVVIGGDGFGYTPDASGLLHKVPQVGRVVVEDDVEIGANTTVDRATLDETRIRRGAKIDNLVQIAHNCDVGEDAIVAAQSGFSGSTRIGRGAIVMAQVGAAGHLKVGERAFVGARAGLHRDVADGARVWGAPQMEEKRWHRAMAALGRLPDVLRRLRALERKVGGAAPPGRDAES